MDHEFLVDHEQNTAAKCNVRRIFAPEAARERLPGNQELAARLGDDDGGRRGQCSPQIRPPPPEAASRTGAVTGDPGRSVAMNGGMSADGRAWQWWEDRTKEDAAAGGFGGRGRVTGDPWRSVGPFPTTRPLR